MTRTTSTLLVLLAVFPPVVAVGTGVVVVVHRDREAKVDRQRVDDLLYEEVGLCLRLLELERADRLKVEIASPDLDLYAREQAVGLRLAADPEYRRLSAERDAAEAEIQATCHRHGWHVDPKVRTRP